MRPALWRTAAPAVLTRLASASLLVGLLSACGGGGAGAQPTPAPPGPASASPSALPSPQRPALSSPPAGAASPVVPAGSPTASGNQQTYEIQPGDSMLTIAEQFYGDATQWRRIYDANRDVIGSNPDTLKPGTTIKIPPKES